jgi:uncharacterized protein
MTKKLLNFALLALLFALPLSAAPHYPSATGYVTDAAGILDASSRQSLEDQLRAFEEATTIEIAVATVPSLEGEVVEDYAVGLFKEWGVGKKGKDNGVLLLVAPNERKMRIEVGYGLEPLLPDGLCGQIIRQDITPLFRESRYAEGVLAGVQSIQRALQGQYAAAKTSSAPLRMNLFWLVFFIFVIGLRLLPFFFSSGSYRGSSYYGGGFGGFGGGGGFGGFGGGSSGGGGASGGW